jgi:hypothetical protein
MKQKTIWYLHLVATALVAIPAIAQTNFYNQVSQMWLAGQKAQVYSIATNRLAGNSNDIAGLVLKMEYELAFVDLGNLTNTMQKVVAVGGGISSTNFVQIFPQLQGEITLLQAAVPNYPTNELAQDVQKGGITNKPMTYGAVLQAIEADGLLDD